MTEFILRVLKAIGDADICSSVCWRCDGEYAPVTFFVNCNDLFMLACADAETITPNNIGVLEQAIVDVTTAGAPIYRATDLFAARVRGMRPYPTRYPKNMPSLTMLFDACGPPRSTNGHLKSEADDG